MSFPLELITMLGSSVLGAVMKLLGAQSEARRTERLATLQVLGKQAEVVDQARRYENPRFTLTRQLIALGTIAAVIVWPKIVPVFWPDIPVTVGWTEFHPGFLFVEGKHVTVWKTVQGLALTPLDTHLVSAIAGLYFGSAVTARR